jgi:endonuclease/exonuclease/phosphatase family metal-dependent hydrolase
MRRLRTVFGLAALLAACGGGAMLAPALRHVPATCRTPSARVTWLAAHAPAQRAEQDAWCAAVGAPVVFDGATARSPVDSVLVVTWNVKVGGGDVRQFIERLRRGELTGGASIHDFVLLLQETHRTGEDVPERVAGARVPRGIEGRTPAGQRTAIDVIARSLGLSLAYVPSMRNGTPGEDRGNAIVTTLPLRDVAAIELPLMRQRRVVVAAQISGRTADGADWALQVASVHLENRPARGLIGAGEREEQMARLLEALPASSRSVIGGDLNTWARGARERAVTLALEHHPDTGDTMDDITFDGPAFFNVRLDYLFARLAGGRMSGYRRIAERFGSDHHPVMAWIHPL